MNDEQLILKIYEKVSIIDDSTPLSVEPVSPDTTFYVVPVRPIPDTIKIQWYIDGQPVLNANSTTFKPIVSALTNGTHQVSVTVTDNTSMVRNEDKRAQLMTKSLQWQINVVKPILNLGTAMDFIDFAFFANHWMNNCSSPDWCDDFDLDYSGRVDFDDLAIFTENWLGKQISADIDNSGQVVFADFASFASHWLQNNCISPDWCGNTDLDKNGKVDTSDLLIFVQYWLDGVAP